MRHKRPNRDLHLVNSRKSAADAVLHEDDRQEYKLLMFTGETVPESGIYGVTHHDHRLPLEVTLLKGQEFPRCSQCTERVEFQVIRTAPHLAELRSPVILYELPVYEIDEGAASVA